MATKGDNWPEGRFRYRPGTCTTARQKPCAQTDHTSARWRPAI